MFIRNGKKVWNLLHIISATIDGNNVNLDKGAPNPEVIHFDTPEAAEAFISDLAKFKANPVNHIEVRAPGQIQGKK